MHDFDPKADELRSVIAAHVGIWDGQHNKGGVLNSVGDKHNGRDSPQQVLFVFTVMPQSLMDNAFSSQTFVKTCYQDGISQSVDAILEKYFPEQAAKLGPAIQREIDYSHGKTTSSTSKHPSNKETLLPMSSYFLTGAVNMSDVCSTHRDEIDHDIGAIVVAGGNFHGGAFLAHELLLRLEMRPGDLLFFPSHCIYHSVEPLESHTPPRYSLVFFNHRRSIEAKRK